ncbi:MAG: DUF6531 domain-containing protein [Pyrinomonadaceae bacterium]
MIRRLLSMATLVAVYLFPLQGIARANTTVAPANPPSPAQSQSCSSCSGGDSDAPANPYDQFATVGRNPLVSPLTPSARSTFEGAVAKFASTATGSLSFSVKDLELKGQPSIAFERTYASDRTEDLGLGRGWFFTYSDTITLGQSSGTLTTSKGAVISLQRKGNKLTPSGPNDLLQQATFQLADANTITQSANDITAVFSKAGEVYQLSRLTDSNGNTITINRGDDGRVVGVSAGNGSALTFEWSGGKGSRLLGVSDSAGRSVSFKSSGGLLRSSSDAVGRATTYDYAGEQLTRVSDPLGRTLLKASHDAAGRVKELGDSVGTIYLQYDSAARGISRRTVVTDAAGARVVYEHNALGALVKSDDGAGQVLTMEYDASNKPVRVANAAGAEATIEYDAQGRVKRAVLPGGAETAYDYDADGRLTAKENGVRREFTRDARGNITAVSVHNAAGAVSGYTASVDARGQVTKLVGGGQEMSLSYDAAGNLVGLNKTGYGRLEIKRDAAGRARKTQMPDGLTQFVDYNERGEVTRRADSKGHSLVYERDAGGALTKVTAANGNWMRAVRDEAGRITSVHAANGRSRHFAYDARGAVTEFVNAKGVKHSFSYDRQGRMSGIIDSHGNKMTFERDARGRAKRILMSDGRSLRYEYNELTGAVASVKEERKSRPEQGRTSGGFTFMKASFAPAAPVEPVALPQMEILNDTLYGEDYYTYWDGNVSGSYYWDPYAVFSSTLPFTTCAGEDYTECFTRRTKECDDRLREDVSLTLAVAATAAIVDAVVAIAATALSGGTLGVPALVIGLLVAAGIAAVTAMEVAKDMSSWKDCYYDRWDMCKNQPGAPGWRP